MMVTSSKILFIFHFLLWDHLKVSVVSSFQNGRSSSVRSLQQHAVGLGAKGFGGSNRDSPPNPRRKGKRSLSDSLEDKDRQQGFAPSKNNNKPLVKAEQDVLLEQLQARAARTCLGQAVANAPNVDDPFWKLIPSLIASRFPTVRDDQLQRVAGFLTHTLNRKIPLEDDIVQDPWRPQSEIHAYMPGLGPTQPFHDASQLELCRSLSANYETIRQEYQALLRDIHSGGRDRFQSVTSMNCDAGWKTLVLFYNGHRIPGFPYHLCPTTTRILETVPLAGRIAGFNRQQPLSGIPLHTDGNNMWLTCQMGVQIPGDGDHAYIRVGPETRYWKAGECLLYDTTYEHETYNGHESQERVVLHVDFFNTLSMTPVEIQVMQYIYSLREEFMKAEGGAKVGAQIF